MEITIGMMAGASTEVEVPDDLPEDDESVLNYLQEHNPEVLDELVTNVQFVSENDIKRSFAVE